MLFPSTTGNCVRTASRISFIRFRSPIRWRKNGASDELIAAGLLHDTIEDAHATPDELRKRFGDEVLRLVSFDTEDKTLPWEERKSATLSAVKTCDRQCAMLVCADKLSNIRDIASDLDRKGEAAWSIFKYGREKQEWLFKSFVTALERLSDLEMYHQFKTDVESVFDKKGNEYHADKG